MGVAGGGRVDCDPSGLEFTGVVPRTDGGANPMPDRGLIPASLMGTPFDGTICRPCIPGLSLEVNTPVDPCDCVCICGLAADCDPAANGTLPR